MGKGKPRHNPRKPANQYGSDCPYYEEGWESRPFAVCEAFACDKTPPPCNGNRHNCCKVKYQLSAIQRKFEQRTGCKNRQRYYWEKQHPKEWAELKKGK